LKSIVERNDKRYVSCKGCIHLKYDGPGDVEHWYEGMAAPITPRWYCRAYGHYLDTWVVSKANDGLYSELVEKITYKTDVVFQLGDSPEEEPKYVRDRLFSFRDLDDEEGDAGDPEGFIVGELEELEEWMRAEPDTLEDQEKRDKLLNPDLMDYVPTYNVHEIPLDAQRKISLEEGRYCDLRIEM